MQKHQRITVNLQDSSYPVIIGSNSFKSLKKETKKQNLYRNIFVVIDENVKKHFSQKIQNSLKSFFTKKCIYILKQGENSKSYPELNKVYKLLIEKKYGRDSLVLAIGGGVTGDLAGYAASTYMRGIQLIHVPTTLLADVDSSIGGKTGINFEKRKNMIGTFYQPKAVLIDTDFLDTLLQNELISGIGEVVKYAFITTPNFYKYIFDNFDRLLKKDKTVLNKIIFESVLFKSSVVGRDEKETGLRKILNFGHTFAHAYESGLNFRIKHGEAVVTGIISALYLSNIKGFLNHKKLRQFLSDINQVKKFSTLKNLNTELVLSIMKNDKKNKADTIRFILLKDIGQVVTDVEATRNDIIKSILLTKNFLNN